MCKEDHFRLCNTCFIVLKFLSFCRKEKAQYLWAARFYLSVNKTSIYYLYVRQVLWNFHTKPAWLASFPPFQWKCESINSISLSCVQKLIWKLIVLDMSSVAAYKEQVMDTLPFHLWRPRFNPAMGHTGNGFLWACFTL